MLIALDSGAQAEAEKAAPALRSARLAYSRADSAWRHGEGSEADVAVAREHVDDLRGYCLLPFGCEARAFDRLDAAETTERLMKLAQGWRG